MKAKSTAPAKQRAKEVEGKEEKEEEHLCFRPAYIKFAAGEISWEEYLHHMLLHFVGRRHAGDELEQEYDVRCIGFYREDPFGYALLEFQRDEIHGSGYVRARHNPTEMNFAYRPRSTWFLLFSPPLVLFFLLTWFRALNHRRRGPRSRLHGLR